MEESHYITEGSAIVHYRRYGNGSRLLFCFHGYGRESNSFRFLEKNLGTTYTMISVDAPFHGITSWNSTAAVEPELFIAILERIAATLPGCTGKISLLGFSMGGRIALHLTQLMAAQTERLVLIAPDGLHFNAARWFLSDTWLGRLVLSLVVRRGRWALFVVDVAQRCKLVPRSLAEFVRYYLHDEEQRIMLYRRWVSMRKFRPKGATLKKEIRKNKVKVRMLFGTFDRVIPASGGRRLRNGIEELATVTEIPAGHNLLSEVHAARITELFTH